MSLVDPFFYSATILGCGDNPSTTGTDESADDNYGDLRVNDHSPAIDQGNNAANTTLTDLAGNTRKVDDTGVTDRLGQSAPVIDLGRL